MTEETLVALVMIAVLGAVVLSRRRRPGRRDGGAEGGSDYDGVRTRHDGNSGRDTSGGSDAGGGDGGGGD